MYYFLPFSITAQTTPSYQVKAAFIYNFTQFVEWPPTAFSSDDAAFVIGVLGTDPFGSYLDQLVMGEKAGKHPITVKRFSDATDVKNCHLLFINAPNAAEVTKILANKSILIVTDADQFATSVGMIRFFTDNSRIRLQINAVSAKAANLNISAKLLRVAEIVEQ